MPSRNIRLFSTDLDGTLLGQPEATERFSKAWAAVPPSRRPLLVYNTGRTVADTLGVIERGQLPRPDFIVGSLGTELHDGLYNTAQEFHARLERGNWNLQVVEAAVTQISGVARQPEWFQRPFKSSWFWPRARREDIDALRVRLATSGLRARVDYSCRYFLDILPETAGKGSALTWLSARLQIPHDQVLVAGDTGNDLSMFELHGIRGIVVQNALPELHAQVIREGVFAAQQAMADGVSEGLTHFGVFQASAGVSSRPAISRGVPC